MPQKRHDHVPLSGDIFYARRAQAHHPERGDTSFARGVREVRHPKGDTLSAPKARGDRIRRMREAFLRLHRSAALCGNTATVPSATRPRKLHIPRPAASGRSRPFRCSSSPNNKRFAGLLFGSVSVLPEKSMPAERQLRSRNDYGTAVNPKNANKNKILKEVNKEIPFRGAKFVL